MRKEHDPTTCKGHVLPSVLRGTLMGRMTRNEGTKGGKNRRNKFLERGKAYLMSLAPVESYKLYSLLPCCAACDFLRYLK